MRSFREPIRYDTQSYNLMHLKQLLCSVLAADFSGAFVSHNPAHHRCRYVRILGIRKISSGQKRTIQSDAATIGFGLQAAARFA